MNTFSIYTYCGFGDHCVAYGIVKEFAKQHQKILLRSDYMTDIAFDNSKKLFSTISNVELIREPINSNVHLDWSIANTAEWFETCKKWDYGDVELPLPNHLEKEVEQWYFDYHWYKNAQLPFHLKWDNFYLNRNLDKEKQIYYDILGLKDNEKFAFLHEDTTRGYEYRSEGYKINREYISPIKIVELLNYPEISILDLTYTLEKAYEIHSFNSGVAIFVDLVLKKPSNLYYHDYVRKKIFWRPTFRLFWQKINTYEKNKNSYETKMPHFYQAVPGWFDYQKIYRQAVDTFSDGARFVEIGAWKGKSTSYIGVELHNSGKNITFDTIDTFKGSDEHTDQKSIINDTLYDEFLYNISPVKQYINPKVGKSQEIGNEYADESLDFVFIDADHSYAEVKKDIELWYPKIKKSGIIAGHDYTNPCGVKQAVDEYFHNKNVQIIGSSWLHRKDYKELYISTGFGVGDQIVAYSIIKHFSKQYDKIYYYSYKEYYHTVSKLYKSLPNVEIIAPEIINNFIHVSDNCLQLGLPDDRQNAIRKNRIIHLDEFMYQQVGIPLEKKWDDFYYERDTETEKNVFYNILGLKDNEEFVVVQDDAYRGMLIPRNNFPKTTKIINTNDYFNISILDFLYTIEKAKEVHVMNSSFLQLIDQMNIKHDNLFYHRYLENHPNRSEEVSQLGMRLNWKVPDPHFCVIEDTQKPGEHKHIEYKYEGISILQHPDVPKYFLKIINQYDRIIELGTYNGAFTLLLNKIKRSDCELISYDIDIEQCKIPKHLNIDIRQGDYYDINIIEEIKNLISDTSKRVLLLCDGGCKEYEFNKFSEYIKPCDMIMLHDYAESFEEYEKFTHAINWFDVPESYYGNIADKIKEYHLFEHPLYDEFKSVLWGAFIKNNITSDDIINAVIKKYNFNLYLEIGVGSGNVFKNVHAPIKEGVDPTPQVPCTYIMTSDEFFKIAGNKKYDVIFIDGLHEAAQSYKDARNAINNLNENGFIIMHDCNPREKSLVVPFSQYKGGPWCGNVYQAFIQLKYELTDWSCFVVDHDWGYGILTRNPILKNEQISLNVNHFSWEGFDTDRKNLLQLISYKNFINLLK